MSVFKLGFSGTRRMMDPRQAQKLSDFLHAAQDLIVELHHGDCVGADAYVDSEAQDLLIPIVIHPPKNATYRAFCGGPRTEWRPEDSYLVRNQHIVLESDVLVACPEGPEDRHPHSGTWYTIRFAIRSGRKVRIIYPDGTVSEPQKNLL